LQEAFNKINEGLADTVVILENDLYRRSPGQKVDLFLKTATHVVVIDSLANKTTQKAELLIPSATFAESEGTLVNNEGRAQRYFPVYPAMKPVRASWQWLINAMENSQWRHHDELTETCASRFPDLAAIIRAAPGANYTVKGNKIPRQPHRYSGRTAMHANIKVSEPAQPQDIETPFSFSMEGAMAEVPPALLPVIWAPGWNSNQAINKFQEETGGHLRDGDPGVRLFEATGTLPWFNDIPSAFKPEQGQWCIMPLPNIFGSEELSLHSPPIAERLPNFCALVNPLDAEALGVNSGDQVEISSLSGAFILNIPVGIELTLSPGLLGTTTGRPEFQSLNTRERVTLKKVSPQLQDNSEGPL
jgi:NADH-quinone oxidoreductase subunit G